MATRTFSLLPFLLLLSTTGIVPCGGAGGARTDAGANELMRACSVTRYRSICVHTLAVFTRVRGAHSPYLWARASVSVALAESKRASAYASSLRRALPRGAKGGAVQDCAECLGDAVAELYSALAEMRRLRPGAGAFAWQMSNVQTWVSAAMTDHDTCLDGLTELREQRQGAGAAPALRGLEAKVLNTTYLCSNALALIHRLAASSGLP